MAAFSEPETKAVRDFIMKQTQKVGGDETGWKFRNIVLSAIAD